MAIGVVGVFMVVMPAAVTAVGRVVGMPMEGPFQQKHEEKAGEHPGHRGIELAGELEVGVGQEMEQPHAEHHAAGEREQHLHPAMAER
jgi:hypothetical protein